MAGYITNGNANLGNGTIASGIPPLVAKTTADEKAYQLLSSKYATIYPYYATSDSNTNNYTAYKNANYGYGDAILETSNKGDSMGWMSDYSYFVYMDSPFFERGGRSGNEVNAGIFTFNAFDGQASRYSISFRVVLATV